MEIFGTIFGWFQSFFGDDLAEHLWGWDGADYTHTNLFTVFGIIALITALLFCVAYYYIINHPRFNRWWSWLIMLVVTGLINLLVGLSITISDLNGEKIAEDIASFISGLNCFMFGVADFFVSAMFFILFSFCLKWNSSNCKHSPFL
jgi:hypothetical protein